MANIGSIEIVRCREGNPKGVVKSWILRKGQITVLVDTGMDARDARKIQSALSGVGKKLRDVNVIVLTHRHGDHTGGLPFLHNRISGPVVAHPAEAGWIAKQTGIAIGELVPGPLPWFPLVEAIHVPGHTAGNLVLYWKSKRTLIAGDAVFSAGCHLIPPPPYLCDDPELASRSLEVLLARKPVVDVVLVSHGEDVYENGGSRLLRMLSRRRDPP